MTSLYNHLVWFIVLFSFCVSSFIFSFYVTFMSQSIYISLNLFSLWNNDIAVSFYFDYMSLWFTRVVLLIRSVVMVYSYFYIRPYSKSTYFLWLTNLFIFSMLIVVNIRNLFFIMLGWDGLGLVSFLLIVYYQNQSSITSGIFTLLINRLGDRLFLVTITLFFYSLPTLRIFDVTLPDVYLISFIVFTFITKRAIFPFSPWLPIAMAAPTPISALVHSSTLVTAGLYLMIRYSYYLYSSYTLIKLLLILSLFTSFYAGINSIFEKDMKKLIALSTLRHLGFIGIAFSVGLLQLAFFHILTHALFKSLLFMAIGDIIINLNHSQDIRYLSSGIVYTPMSCGIIYVSLLNLLGMPNIRGYFSKDLILEILNYSNFSCIALLLVFINVFFTYYYTYQLFFYSFQPIKLVPYQNFHSPLLLHTAILFFLSIRTLFFGFFFISHICHLLLFLPVPAVLKWLPLLINALVFTILYINGCMFTSSHPILNYYFSNIIFLSNTILTIRSNMYYHLRFILSKSVERGLLNYTLNTYTKERFLWISTYLLKLSSYNPLKVTFYRSLLLIVLVVSLLLNNIIYYIWLLLIKFLKNLTYVNLRTIKFSRGYKSNYRANKLFSRLHNNFHRLNFVFCYLYFCFYYFVSPFRQIHYWFSRFGDGMDCRAYGSSFIYSFSFIIPFIFNRRCFQS